MVTAALLLGLVAVGCSGADTGVIEQDLEAQAQAQSDLRQRITDLETSIQALSGESGSGQQELRTVADRLTDLEEALDSLSTLLSEEKAARASELAAAGEARGALDTRLDRVESQLGSIAADLQRLENMISALTARLDQHEDGHP